mmetsp:Transcript_5649/g.23962  ORF Transcript_5649/g.23962 Transcript_5649/m.23962 type:complete len:341 (-) Transcript_5649:77-1099(-)
MIFFIVEKTVFFQTLVVRQHRSPLSPSHIAIIPPSHTSRSQHSSSIKIPHTSSLAPSRSASVKVTASLQNSHVTSTFPCSSMMLWISSFPMDASARIMRTRSSPASHGPYLGTDSVATSGSEPSDPSTRSAISFAPTPSAIMSVVEGKLGMLCSSAAMVSSLANGSTCTMYPPAERTFRSRSRDTPTAIAEFTCSLSCRYTAISSAISPVVMFTIPLNGAFHSGCARLTVSNPRPTAPPTFSLPSGRNGGSAFGLLTNPLTCPVLSEMAMICPIGPSPLNVICVVSSSPLNVPSSVAASMVRPSAAVAVGAVLCRETASETSDVPTTVITLTSWFADITR